MKNPAVHLAAVLALGSTLVVAPDALRAADYTDNGTTNNFSITFTPAISGATTADDLIFGGAAYTATDDVSGVNVNGLRFNNTGTVTVARGSGSNTLTLGGSNPYIDFNNTGLITLATDTTFASNGYIVKSTSGAGATNPIISGGLTLSIGKTTTVVLADSPADTTPELSLTGAITGAGTLTLQNNAVLPAALSGNAGIAAPANQQDYGTLLISGNNTGFSGATNLNAGRLVTTNAHAFGKGTVTVAGPNTPSGGSIASSGGTFALGSAETGGTIASGITIPNNLMLAGATSGVYGHGLENNSGTNTLSGTVTLTATGVITTINAGTSLTMSSSVTETSGLGALLTKQGAGSLLINNASYSGGTSIQGGTMEFTGTAPTSGQITVGTSAAQSSAALIFGTGTAFPTVASLIPRLNTASTGSINLTANSNEAINFDNLGGGTLSLGSASAAPGITYTGTITGTVVNLGGGIGGGVLTLPNTNQITGGSFLTVGPIGSAGTVFLSAANNYSSGTAIAGGTLEIASAASIGSGTLQFGAALNVSGGGGTLQYAPGPTNNLAANDITAGGRTVTEAGFVVIDTNGNNVTYAGGFTSNTSLAPGSFTKTGLGVLTLNGTFGTSATVTGGTDLFVRQGTLAISGAAASFTTSTYSAVGQLQGDTGTLVIANGGKIITPSDFNVADVNGTTGTLLISGNSSLAVNTLYVGKGGNNTAGIGQATSGAFNQTGGTVSNNAGGLDWRIGGGTGPADGSALAIGTYDLSGGTLNPTSNFQVGAYGTGQMTISGTGAATISASPSIGRFAGGYGVLNVLGGSLTQSGTGNFLTIGDSGTGTLNVGYGAALTTALVNAANGPQLRIGNVAGAVGIVNLGTGGTIRAQAVNTLAGTSSVVNFHGGTLTATSANTPFMTGLTSAYIYREGGTVDTGTNNITIGQGLLAPTGVGLQSIAVTNGGSGYQASPLITIIGGGFGASAIPILTNGVLTSIVVTNPGIGYTVVPTITVSGGNPTTPATLGTATFSANPSGQLTKVGTGTLTLSGTNTYTGGTNITVGSVVAANASSLGSAGNITLASGTVLDVSALGTPGYLLASGRTLTSNGGIVSGILNVSGTYQGFGTINGGLTVNGGGLVAGTGGTLVLGGAVTNNGTIRMTGGAVLDASSASSFVNNGVLDLINGSAKLPSNFTNGTSGMVLTADSVRVKSVSKTGTGVTVLIDSLSGHGYQLQRASTLVNSSYTNVSAVQNGTTGTTLTFTDPAPPAGQGFYRIIINP